MNVILQKLDAEALEIEEAEEAEEGEAENDKRSARTGRPGMAEKASLPPLGEPHRLGRSCGGRCTLWRTLRRPCASYLRKEKSKRTCWVLDVLELQDRVALL